jgi:AmmeMemoRadiSam system protein B
MLRRSAVAGTWYPADPARLTGELRSYLDAADTLPTRDSPPATARLFALVCPHAGLMYSGPVAAHAYRLLRQRPFEVVVLVGPSHYVAFEGVSIWPAGAFATPLGNLPIDEALASDIAAACPVVVERTDAHAREHSLEMQLPFLAYLAPGVPIVPLVMGHQTRATATALGDALARALDNRRALLVASSDLSHYFDAATAAALDREVVGDVDRLDAEALMTRLERRPEHACGGGPIVSVLRAARALGATRSRVVHYADSGDVSGDKSAVVGYLAAAMWQ